MITIEKSKYHNEHYEGFKFVLQAIDLKDPRKNLHLVFIRDKKAYATDGHRIHCYHFGQDEPENVQLGLESGLYTWEKTKDKILLFPDTENFQYPNIDNVWPKKETCKKLYIKASKEMTISYLIIGAYKVCQGFFNPAYLDCLPINKEYYIFGTDKLSPILIENHTLSAVVMSIRADDNEVEQPKITTNEKEASA